MVASFSLLVVTCLLMAGSSFGQTVITLEPHTIEAGSLTVSGISAGGAMATQLHVAFSKDVNGVGIFAGLPYGCAQGTLNGALNCMSYPGLTNVDTLTRRTDKHATDGLIDPTANMRDDKVYIFQGSKDSTVDPRNGGLIETYYTNYLSATSNIKTEFTLPAEHCQPTDNYGTACGVVNSQYYINNCNYRGAYDALNHMYGGNLKPGVPYVPSSLHVFDQKEFFNNRPNSASIDNEGYVYIPVECEDPTRICKLHIALHGCLQGAYKIGDVFVKNAGYLEVAEANAIIVVFPQAINTALSNPNGCFDWWGYHDNNYDVKTGAQMDGIWQMIKKIGYVPV